MKIRVRRSAAAAAAVATAGASSVFLGAAPASALPNEPCVEEGYLVAPGICEISYLSGEVSFTPTAEMTQLEVLLVGAGGSGVAQATTNSDGYAAAGGGGEVLYIDATGVTDTIEFVVGEPGGSNTIYDDGTDLFEARNGHDGVVAALDTTGGDSGNLNAGSNAALAGGAGAGEATVTENGGAGVVVAELVPSGSLFESDLSCYGGGGAAANGSAWGTPGCGGGQGTIGGESVLPPEPNSGGGGGAVHTAQAPGTGTGAAGIVKVRWNAAPVTITFNVMGKGTAPAPQEVIPGFTAAEPPAPEASGWEFKGWFHDEALTIPVDFSAPVLESTTYYAAWAPALAATGSAPELTVLPLALGALAVGAGALLVAKRRRQA